MQSLNAATFDSFLAQREVAVILLFTPAEDTYLRAQPVLEDLERGFAGVSFGLINGDEPSFALDFFEARDFPRSPATLYYQHGVRVQISIGIGYAEIYRLQVVRTLERLLKASSGGK